jgi:hypothetical protein
MLIMCEFKLFTEKIKVFNLKRSTRESLRESITKAIMGLVDLEKTGGTPLSTALKDSIEYLKKKEVCLMIEKLLWLQTERKIQEAM